PTAIGLLHLVCNTPDMGRLYLRRRDYSDLELFLNEHADEFLTPIPDQHYEPDKYEFFLAEVKTAQMLQAWLEETREDDIHEQFGVGAGDIRRVKSGYARFFKHARDLFRQPIFLAEFLDFHPHTIKK
ncbi:unnamed protein product, partial [marine sediment metagenome]